MVTALVFGLFDAAKAAKLDALVPAWLDSLPGAPPWAWAGSPPSSACWSLQACWTFAIGNKQSAAQRQCGSRLIIKRDPHQKRSCLRIHS